MENARSIQWTGKNNKEVERFLGSSFLQYGPDTLYFKTLEGVGMIRKGDVLTVTDEGIFYAMENVVEEEEPGVAFAEMDPQEAELFREEMDGIDKLKEEVTDEHLL